jgi:mannan endo-1,4-beta-mannosidase
MKGAFSRVFLVCLVMLGAGCGVAGAAPRAPRAPAAQAAARGPAWPRMPSVYIGVFERGVPRSYQPVVRFATTVGVRPNLVLYYSGWNESFRLSFARAAHAHGATPLVQIDPDHVSLRAIAAGKYDTYLREFGRSVGEFGHPVVIGFGHEMNGSWSSWGWRHVSPAVFVAAWRHIFTVMRRAGAGNVIWMWTINVIGPAAAAPRPWWPGTRYVTWVGVDGYFTRPGDNFTSVFARTVTAVRKLTREPLLISEVGISPAAGKAARLPGLFAGIRRDHLAGLVWFDVDQSGGPYRKDWRLEGYPAAMAAFRAGAQALRAWA